MSAATPPDAARPPSRGERARRYGPMLLLLAPVSAGLGLLSGVGLAALDGFRTPVADALGTGLSLATAGLVSGALGTLGALAAVLLARRGDAALPARAGIGAALAILAAWWVYGAVFFVLAPNYNVFGIAVAVVGIVVAAVGGLVARLLAAAASRRGLPAAPRRAHPTASGPAA